MGIGSVVHPMCRNSCVAFTGPFMDLDHCLQKEGLIIWNAAIDQTFKSRLFLALNTADGQAMAYLSSLVGHHRKFGCRLYCPTPGRHKTNGSHYYPALLKPLDYTMASWDHPDLSHFSTTTSRSHYFTNLCFLLASPNDTQYKKRQLEMEIVKPTIFLGLPTCSTLGILWCLGSDIMNLGTFNLSDLLLPLSHGLFNHDRLDSPSNWPWAVLQGEIWESHGVAVSAATPSLPGSFDHPPHNIAEKINSGYKAWEWLLYLYSLAPALLFGILPEPYHSHFCKLVWAMRIIQQYHISSSDLVLADGLFRSFAYEFELLYYQWREDWIHFCWQSIHTLLHLAPEVTRIGPPICSSQWTMERTIGNLCEEIRQPYFRDHNLIVVDVTSIKPVVAMITHTPPGIDVMENKYYYLMEQPGLDVTDLGGIHKTFDSES